MSISARVPFALVLSLAAGCSLVSHPIGFDPVDGSIGASADAAPVVPGVEDAAGAPVDAVPAAPVDAAVVLPVDAPAPPPWNPGKPDAGPDAPLVDAPAFFAPGPHVAPKRETPLANCPAYPTLGDMDRFFASRCGIDSQCHDGETWSNYRLPNVFERLLDVSPKFTCKKDRLIDSRNPYQSVLYIKSHTRVPKCTVGTGGGTTMPPPNNTQMAVPLTDAERACILSFLFAAIGYPFPVQW